MNLPLLKINSGHNGLLELRKNYFENTIFYNYYIVFNLRIHYATYFFLNITISIFFIIEFSIKIRGSSSDLLHFAPVHLTSYPFGY